MSIRTIGAWLAAPVAWGEGRMRRSLPASLARWLVRAWAASLRVTDHAGPDAAAPLEVFLRVGPRDLAVVSLVLASLREHLVNVVSRVVVATPRPYAEDLATRLEGTTVVADEDLISASLRQAIDSAVPPGRRSWVTQQFLSLIHVSTAARQPCLVWDADTVLVRRQSVLQGDVAVLDVSTEHHSPYFTLMHSLLPSLPLPVWGSTIAHHMLMEPEFVNELLEEIERECGQPWWRAILDRVDPDEASCMAEYEIYGQWLRTRHPERVRLAPFRNIALSRRHLPNVVATDWATRRNIDSVSFHWWIPDRRA